jgi:hypothetical protein
MSFGTGMMDPTCIFCCNDSGDLDLVSMKCNKCGAQNYSIDNFPVFQKPQPDQSSVGSSSGTALKRLKSGLLDDAGITVDSRKAPEKRLHDVTMSASTKGLDERKRKLK